eukprot:g4250.t1
MNSDKISLTGKGTQHRIASLVLDTFKKLPNKCKPQINEWTCLAAIVASSEDKIKVLTIATGNKCLGLSKMCSNGTVVNDSHAEILARRALKLLLWKKLIYNLKQQSAKDVNSSRTSTNIEENLFCWKNHGANNNNGATKKQVEYHLFISELPCGDASIVVSPADNQEVNRTKILKRTGAKLATVSNNVTMKKMNVIKYEIEDKEQKVGLLRTKSGRSDLRPCDRSTCMSCSDKIVSWFFGGLQGSLLSHFIKPIYLSSIIVGHHCSDNANIQKDIMNAKSNSLHRAIVGRLSSVYNRVQQQSSISALKSCVAPSVFVTPIDFQFSRNNYYYDNSSPWIPKNATKEEREIIQKKRKRHENVKKKRSPTGNAMYCLFPLEKANDHHLIECLIAARGVRQGASKKSKSRKTWSYVSKVLFLECFHKAINNLKKDRIQTLGLGHISDALTNLTYSEIKNSSLEYMQERKKLFLDEKFKFWLKGPTLNFTLPPEEQKKESEIQGYKKRKKTL